MLYGNDIPSAGTSESVLRPRKVSVLWDVARIIVCTKRSNFPNLKIQQVVTKLQGKLLRNTQLNIRSKR